MLLRPTDEKNRQTRPSGCGAVSASSQDLPRPKLLPCPLRVIRRHRKAPRPRLFWLPERILSDGLGMPEKGQFQTAGNVKLLLAQKAIASVL